MMTSLSLNNQRVLLPMERGVSLSTEIGRSLCMLRSPTSRGERGGGREGERGGGREGG